MAKEVEDDVFFADLSKQIARLIMDDDEEEFPVRCPSLPVQVGYPLSSSRSFQCSEVINKEDRDIIVVLFMLSRSICCSDYLPCCALFLFKRS